MWNSIFNYVFLKHGSFLELLVNY
uniref:Uncharacterized protein n=1 Tax=Anguilla anguilla TaxID=7936 RepID=A0A0E9THY4_ANGAN